MSTAEEGNKLRLIFYFINDDGIGNAMSLTRMLQEMQVTQGGARKKGSESVKITSSAIDIGARARENGGIEPHQGLENWLTRGMGNKQSPATLSPSARWLYPAPDKWHALTKLKPKIPVVLTEIRDVPEGLR